MYLFAWDPSKVRIHHIAIKPCRSVISDDWATSGNAGGGVFLIGNAFASVPRLNVVAGSIRLSSPSTARQSLSSIRDGSSDHGRRISPLVRRSSNGPTYFRTAVPMPTNLFDAGFAGQPPQNGAETAKPN